MRAWGTKKANTELHNVRWVVGSEIENTFDTLRKYWFWFAKVLHIERYKNKKYKWQKIIEEINLRNYKKDKIDNKELVKIRPKDFNSLLILKDIYNFYIGNISLDFLQPQLN